MLFFHCSAIVGRNLTCVSPLRSQEDLRSLSLLPISRTTTTITKYQWIRIDRRVCKGSRQRDELKPVNVLLLWDIVIFARQSIADLQDPGAKDQGTSFEEMVEGGREDDLNDTRKRPQISLSFAYKKTVCASRAASDLSQQSLPLPPIIWPLPANDHIDLNKQNSSLDKQKLPL